MTGEVDEDALERVLEGSRSSLSPSRDFESQTTDNSLRRELESEVECPVCYNIPRTLPVPCCPAGHITCSRCRSRVVHCPTCRRQLGENTSHLAAAIIDKVNHKCRFWEHGCGYKSLLKDLESHEEICTERTVQCPLPNGCEEIIPLKNFHLHAMRNGCAVAMKPVMKFNLSRGFLSWDGPGHHMGEAFNKSEDLAWSFFHTRRDDNDFFFSAQYYAVEQLFMFYVTVMAGKDVADSYWAVVEVVKGDLSMKYRGPVLALDQLPSGERELMNEEGCFVVHYRGMRNLLVVTEVGENRNKAWSVDFDAKVDILEREEHQTGPDRLTKYFLEPSTS